MVAPLHDEPPIDDPSDEYVDDDDTDNSETPSAPMVVAHRRPGAVVPALDRAEIIAGQAARRAPYLAGAAAAATGYGAWGLVHLAADSGQPAVAGTIALGACAANGATLLTLRIRYRDRGQLGPMTPAGRRLFWKAGTFFTAWADAMALGAADIAWVGPHGMGAILFGGGAWLCRRWMRDHPVELHSDTPAVDVPAADPEPAPAEVKAPEPPQLPTRPAPDEGDLLKEKWNTLVAAGKDPIALGATLGDDREDLPHGYRWVVQLYPEISPVTATQLCQRAEDVAFRFGLRKTHVRLAPLRGVGEREDRAMLTVVTRDILAGIVPYPGPRYLPDGRIPLGLVADGSGPAYWRTKDDKGPRGGMVVGGSGSGKSHILTLLGMAMRAGVDCAGGEYIVVVGDGDTQGQSAPLLKRIAYDFAPGPARVMQQLEAMEAWYSSRGSTMGKHTVVDGLPVPITDPETQLSAAKLMPCRHLAGWIWILDEFKALADELGQDFVRRVGRLRREMRKRGGALIVGTQSGGVGDFGGDEMLQSQLMQDNVVVLATRNDHEQYALPANFGCDPTTLPDDGGYGFTNDPKGDKLMFRAYYDEHMDRWARALPPYQPDEPSARVYAYKRPPTPADPVADYHESVRREAETMARIEKGERLPWEEQPEPDPEERPAPGGDDVTAGPRVDPSQYSIGGVAIAEAPLGPMFAHLGASPSTPQPDTAPLHPKSQQILDLLRSDPARVWRTGEIAEALGMSLSDASTFARKLLAPRLAHCPGEKTGRFQAGPATVAATGSETT